MSPTGLRAAQCLLVRLLCVLGAKGAGGGTEEVRMDGRPQQAPGENADREEVRGIAAKAANPAGLEVNRFH